MKRVRKYTYLPQEEIEVIETKSGETIKSKEILDGNYVKAKPAPKKVVKKAVKRKYAKGGVMPKGARSGIKIKNWYVKNYPTDELGEDINDTITFKGYWAMTSQGYNPYEVLGVGDSVVRERVDGKLSEILGVDNYEYKKGGKLVGNQKKLDVNKNGKLDSEDFKILRGEKMADGGSVQSKYIITYDDGDDISRVWVNARNKEDAKEQAFEEYSDIKEIISVEKMMADGGETDKIKVSAIFEGNLKEANAYVLEWKKKTGGSFSRRAIKNLPDNQTQKYIISGQVSKEAFDEFDMKDWSQNENNADLISMHMANGGSIQDIEKYVAKKYFNGDERGFSVSKNMKGKYEFFIDNHEQFEADYGDSLDFISLVEEDINKRFQTMAKGGKVGMYQLMPYVNMGEKFSSPSFKETINFEGTQDEAINKANNMVDNSDRITSVEVSIINPKATNVLKMTKKIEMVRGTKMAKGGKTPVVRTQFEEEEFEYAKGGTINMNKHIWEGWTVGDFIEALDIEFKYHPKFKSRDEVKKWAMENQPYYKKYIPDVVDYYWQKNEEKMTRGNGFEYYADGGEAGRFKGTYRVMIGNRKPRILADDMTRDEAKDFMNNYSLKYPKAELELRYNMTEADHKSVSDNVNKAMKEHMSGYKMADGGKVTDKEVAESNVHMLQSNIKSIKHHAEELEDAIKDDTEVEGWVLAKADRAATAMSDITHYLDGRKMGTGGMVAGHYYKDKAGSDLRYIGPDSKNDDLGIFKDGEKYLTKPFNEFEEEKEKKSFWFGNGGFMPSGFSRKVSLSEKAEEMVGKNTWHILDAAQKGEVIGELISDGALAVTMDRGGIVDADDWSKSMTQDKIYALKKAGYSENIASEMSLLPYEQLPMWVRQDFKKGSIVIGAYHIHKNDNEVPIDGKVLVLNGDEEVVYSAETLDQAQEWAINQMQEVEDDGNYIYVSDCCGAEAGDFYDVGICPMCREHCGWEKESTYADGGVTEATKFKVVYKLKDAAEPKEKLFDNAEKAEFFLETIQEDDDIESANLVEVKPMKKAAEKKAPTNLFAAAKPAAASSASKKTKEDVLVPGIADRIARYDALKAIIKNAEAEKEVIGGSLKEVGKEKFLELYELRRRNPETFNLADEDEKIMFIVMDKYIKVEPEKAGMLENYPGLLETTTTYKFNPALLDRTGEIISRLIMESTELSDDEKANLIVAETKVGIKSGSIDRLMDYDNPAQIFDLIEPILALK